MKRKMFILIIILYACFCYAKYRQFVDLELRDCIRQQLQFYGDLCGEASDFQDETPEVAHYLGVECAVNACTKD